MATTERPHPFSVARHLECGRKLTPLPAGGSICLHCRVAFEDVEHDGVKARVVVDEGGR